VGVVVGVCVAVGLGVFVGVGVAVGLGVFVGGGVGEAGPVTEIVPPTHANSVPQDGSRNPARIDVSPGDQLRSSVPEAGAGLKDRSARYAVGEIPWSARLVVVQVMVAGDGEAFGAAKAEFNWLQSQAPAPPKPVSFQFGLELRSVVPSLVTLSAVNPAPL
jgi:hypothetical protein